MQSCKPSDVGKVTPKLQASLDAMLSAAMGSSAIFQPGFELERRRAQIRTSRGGMGLRRMDDISKLAFLGGTNMTVPRMANRYTSDGVLITGFLHVIHTVVGEAWNTDLEVDRFKAFLESGSDTAAEFEQAWNWAHDIVGANTKGPMSEPIADFGFNVGKTQKEVAAHVEEATFPKLQDDYKTLPHTSHNRWAFESISNSKTATKFLQGWPDAGGAYTTAQFLIAINVYMGTPIPTIAAFVGEKLKGNGLGNGVACDPYGAALAAAQLTGGDWWKAHSKSREWSRTWEKSVEWMWNKNPVLHFGQNAQHTT